MKCFFSDCKNEVNERGKFCEYHDKKERDALADIALFFSKNSEKEERNKKRND